MPHTSPLTAIVARVTRERTGGIGPRPGGDVATLTEGFADGACRDNVEGYGQAVRPSSELDARSLRGAI